MQIGILGSGDVGRTLAAGLVRDGHAVMIGSGTPTKLHEFVQATPGVRSGSFDEAARFGDLAVLAVKGSAAAKLVGKLAEALAGRTVLDTTNPIAEGAPEQGVLSFFTGPNQSLLERLQAEAPRARFVKAFNSVGAAAMVHPNFGTRPTMFICGDDAGAREQVRGLVESLGWECEDCGGGIAARAIEPLCVLWCLPGFRSNDWNHAFKLLRK